MIIISTLNTVSVADDCTVPEFCDRVADNIYVLTLALY